MIFMGWLTIYQQHVGRELIGRQPIRCLLTETWEMSCIPNIWIPLSRIKACNRVEQAWHMRWQTAASVYSVHLRTDKKKKKRHLLPLPVYFPSHICSLTQAVYKQPSILLSLFSSSTHPCPLLPSLSPSLLVAKTFICSEHFPYFMPCQPQVGAEGN